MDSQPQVLMLVPTMPATSLPNSDENLQKETRWASCARFHCTQRTCAAFRTTTFAACHRPSSCRACWSTESFGNSARLMKGNWKLPLTPAEFDRLLNVASSSRVLGRSSCFSSRRSRPPIESWRSSSSWCPRPIRTTSRICCCAWESVQI